MSETEIIATYTDTRDNLTAFVFESNLKCGGYGVSLRDNDSGEFVPGSIHGLTLEEAKYKARGITGNLTTEEIKNHD